MSETLPVFLEPWRFSDLTKQFSGEAGLAELPRLGEAVIRLEGEARYALRFYRDERRRIRVAGQVSAVAVLVCQRCLGEVACPLSGEISLAVVEGLAEVEHLPEDVEPLLLEPGERRPSLELVEDELLLALPQIPRHDDGDCAGEAEAYQSDEAEAEPEGSQRDNPFAVLAGLKRDG
jgi:uncharacterized protein